MTSVAKTNTFVAGTNAEAAKVNQNFDDLVTYINDEVIVRDASKAFTSVPSGPATNPSTDNQFTRKKYVDDLVTPLTATVTSNKAAADASFKKRPSVANDDRILKMDEVVTSTNSLGEVTITFPVAYGTATESVVACNADPTTGAALVSVTAKTKTGFTVRVYKDTVSAPFGAYGLDRHASASVRLSYFAVGY